MPDSKPAEGIKYIGLERIDEGVARAERDAVVVEQPLTLFVNDEEWITLLCTPRNILELAVGFLRSEGLVLRHEEVLDSFVDLDQGTIEIQIPALPALYEKLRGKRTLTSGCAAGTLFYKVTDTMNIPRVVGDVVLRATDVYGIMSAMQRDAQLFKETGGAHIAALATPSEVLLTMEDIGRHNAVDKIVGASVLREIETQDKILLSSGRISSEMLLKAARVEIPIVVSRSAPTSLAVQIADEVGITLVGFARNFRLNVYSHAKRIDAERVDTKRSDSETDRE